MRRYTSQRTTTQGFTSTALVVLSSLLLLSVFWVSTCNGRDNDNITTTTTRRNNVINVINESNNLTTTTTTTATTTATTTKTGSADDKSEPRNRSSTNSSTVDSNIVASGSHNETHGWKNTTEGPEGFLFDEEGSSASGSASGSGSGSGNFDYQLVIVGAVVSTGLCAVALLVCFIGCYCRKKQAYGTTGGEHGGYHIKLDEVELDELIGVGNFGQVFRGTWRGLEVAIKKLPLQFDEQMLLDFKREIEILRLVQHPNIVKFYGAVVRSPDFCIITEYVANGSLYKILHNPETLHLLDERMLKSIAIDTAEGVKYLHSRDPPIIHRDIKSHNILLSKGWRVKICDFGLSKVLDKSNDQKKMSLCGTPSWAAPEVLRNQPYSEKADIYSFGIVLWEMITKSDPFGGMPPFQIVFAVGSQGQRPPIPPTCPHEWAMLIRDCWDEDPNRRPTVNQIISRLQAFEE